MSVSRTSDYLIQKHPLQRLHSPARGISALLHILGLSSFIWSFKFLLEHPNHASDSYGWHFQFLTIIGLSLSTLTFGVGLLADISMSRRLFLFKNLLSVCSAPLEVLVSLLYWSLKAIDERLVIPPDAGVPLNTDLGFHFVPSVVMLLDLLFFSPPWTISVVPALGLSSMIAFGYWFWIELCYQNNGWYPYPIFEMLPTAGRIALFSGSAVIMALSTVTLKWLYGRVNGYGDPIPAQSRAGAIKRTEFHS